MCGDYTETPSSPCSTLLVRRCVYLQLKLQPVRAYWNVCTVTTFATQKLIPFLKYVDLLDLRLHRTRNVRQPGGKSRVHNAQRDGQPNCTQPYLTTPVIKRNYHLNSIHLLYAPMAVTTLLKVVNPVVLNPAGCSGTAVVLQWYHWWSVSMPFVTQRVL